MTDVTRLVCSIIQFLEDQLKCGDLTSDAAESLEVAIQCLEQAYCVSHDNAPSQLPSLLEIFRTSHSEQIRRSPTPEVSPERKKEAENLKNKGNDLMKNEKFTEAVQCYSHAIDIDSRNAIYFCNRAAAYSKLNNHAAAIIDCDRAILIDCTYSKAYGRKGLAHASLGQHREAKECYEKAAKLDPTNESYINNLHIAEEKLKETNLHNQAPMSGRQVPPSGPQAQQQIPPGMFGMESSNFNLSNLLSNPALMNMATQMMTDPNMQQLLGNFLSGSAGSGGAPPPGPAPAPAPAPSAAPPPPAATPGSPAGVQALLQAGQQLAAQMQASNPELVEQLRQQMSSGSSGGANPSSREQTPK